MVERNSSHPFAIVLAGCLAGCPVGVAAQTSDLAQAMAAAEAAKRQAAAAAAAATAAAEAANAAVARVEKLLGKPAPADPKLPTPNERLARYTLPPADYHAIKSCDDADDNVATVSFFRRAQYCEDEVFRRKGHEVAPARSAKTTGVGTSLAVDSKGSAATFMLDHSWLRRSLRIANFGKDQREVEQQRIIKWTVGGGVRADIQKDSDTSETLATFGSLDHLTSNIALLFQFGWSASTSEPWDEIKGARHGPLGTWDSQSSLVADRAAEMRSKIEAECRKDKAAKCDGEDLFDWLFATDKPKGSVTRDFLHPDQIKLYNAVYWGPPRDALPRFGFLFKGEISRPKFDYYPFALAKVPDPFHPGKTKTVIDPAQFPPNFGARMVSDDARLNWSFGARGFFHLSQIRTKNLFNLSDSAAAWTLGTTLVGSLSYIRKDEIQKDFKGVKTCPPAAAGQTFVTEQACSTIDIAAPDRTQGFVVGGEFRQGIDLGVIPPVLFAARYTHSFDRGENGVVAPLYFSTDDKGLFTGGLRVGYTWGGKNADGSAKPSDFRFGIVAGVKIGLDGSTSIE